MAAAHEGVAVPALLAAARGLERVVVGQQDDVEAIAGAGRRGLMLLAQLELGGGDREVVAQQPSPAQALGAVVECDHAPRSPPQ